MLGRDLFHEQGSRSLGEELNIWLFLLYPILALPLLMFSFKHPEEKEFLAFPSRQPFCCWVLLRNEAVVFSFCLQCGALHSY
jgi:hypothetical protein